jgi:hypothetical protein
MHEFLKFYFGNETPHVSDSSSVHHQEVFTIPSAMVYVIQVCRQLSSRSRIRTELLMTDRGTVRKVWSFISKTKFEKLVYLVGFIIKKTVGIPLLKQV